MSEQHHVPWSTFETEDGAWAIDDAGGRVFATVLDTDRSTAQERAELIVRAVNAFHPLVVNRGGA